MADTKVTGLTALTGANSAPGDLLTLVDVSDTTMDAAGTNKKQTRQEFQTYNAGTLTTDVKVLDLSATWNDAGVTFTGLKFNVTSTASAAASLLLDLQVGGTSKLSVTKSSVFTLGSGNGRFGFDASADWVSYIKFNGTNVVSFSNVGGITLVTNDAASFYGMGSGTDLRLYRDAAATLAQRNGTNAQTFRLYNTFTDASNYERLGINWGSNIISIKPEAAGTGTVRVLHISGLPTSNPGPGILWNNAGTPAIGT
jgi:hypothetical protein